MTKKEIFDDNKILVENANNYRKCCKDKNEYYLFICNGFMGDYIRTTTLDNIFIVCEKCFMKEGK